LSNKNQIQNCNNAHDTKYYPYDTTSLTLTANITKQLDSWPSRILEVFQLQFIPYIMHTHSHCSNFAVHSFRAPYLLCTSRSNVTRCQGNRFWGTKPYEMSAERSTADATVLFLCLGLKFVNTYKNKPCRCE